MTQDFTCVGINLILESAGRRLEFHLVDIGVLPMLQFGSRTQYFRGFDRCMVIRDLFRVFLADGVQNDSRFRCNLHLGNSLTAKSYISFPAICVLIYIL